ncbi:MAG: tetratricopeptide repeat protein [Candidatus Omnitrophica bacterium]|nr:tetratricopeptide repeat protein [Candidatus Omnitrophota bacterium]
MLKIPGTILAFCVWAYVYGPLPVHAASPQVLELNRQGVEAMNDARVEEALEYFQEAYALAPEEEVIQKHLAVVLNQRATQLLRNSDPEPAIELLNRALELDPQAETVIHNLAQAHLYLGRALMEIHRAEEAEPHLRRARELWPEEPLSYVLLGSIAYDRQDLADAENLWQKALELDPDLSEVEKALDKLQRERPVEDNFRRVGVFPFELRVDEALDPFDELRMRTLLNQVYREVGQDFGYWPKHTVVVLVYHPDNFRRGVDMPHWAAGAYDGKVRVVDRDYEDLPLPNLVRHEYTHAVIHELAQGRCPRWFNEGLAECEGGYRPLVELEYLRLAIEQNSLYAFDALDAAFDSPNPDEVRLAYYQSTMLVRYLIDRYGFWSIRQILEDLGQNPDLQSILQERCALSLENFRRQAVRHFLQNLD